MTGALLTSGYGCSSQYCTAYTMNISVFKQTTAENPKRLTQTGLTHYPQVTHDYSMSRVTIAIVCLVSTA